MYFAQWLLARIKKTLVGERWDWVDDYRQTIIKEKPLAILITVGLGLIWFLLFMLITVLGVYNGRATEMPSWIVWVAALAPVTIFLYNWIMALYEIFDAERMATWETLKNKNL